MHRTLAVAGAALIASAVLSVPAHAGVLDGPWKRALGRPAPAVAAPLVLAPGTVRSLDEIRPSGAGLHVAALPGQPALWWTGTTCAKVGAGAWRMTASWVATGAS